MMSIEMRGAFGWMTSRRSLMGVAALAALMPSWAAFSAAASPRSLTFVLVHGAWHGGWCWQLVADLLRGAGHHVFAPTLTGCGDRLHLSSPKVDIRTHVTDVLATLHYEDLHDVVLVGHSYAGLVISQVASQGASLIRSLVYLDAFVPDPGQSFVDLIGNDVVTTTEGEGVEPMLTVRDLGITDPALARFVEDRLSPHPAGSFRQKVAFDPEVLSAIPRHYLETSALFGAESAKAASLGMDVRKIEGAGHDVMLTQPALLADALIEMSSTGG